MDAIFDLSSVPLDQLSPQSRLCIEQLHRHEREPADLTSYPVNKLAAVLILLFERAGRLRVLLTTRSKLLRSHPGQTALPGGKVDPLDQDILETAYREAHEEVALPLDSPQIYNICLLRPFLSSYKLFVTPVIALLTDNSILDGLKANPSEVDGIFDHPLEALLDPSLVDKEILVPKGGELWPYETDLHSTSDAQYEFLGGASYRMHRFRSTASPVKGLTAEILTTAAEIAYGRKPVYERYAEGQIQGFAGLYRVLREVESKKVLPSNPGTPVIV
ncbi:hypothetical protein JAAARDRAFT_33749 [Jaapia argillacea MUCL 33604]|uniref:Nudix hydrolase domain-containing protein n=1 Tax=Jaapia argillacea MUCL 33604 TaxID=933084 RepID=A0A067PZT1_9AGAM|nr:hypothetical protein JAAARDRAFT_33749 [Jaapia argillacea MUCL 33604]